jgi:hypothetical protein
MPNHDTQISSKHKAWFPKFDENKDWKYLSQTFSFRKKEATCDFGQGAVYMQVLMFSGCS